MKKQNETNEQTNTTQKREKKEHTFFLYVPERGFICCGHDEVMPTVGGSEPIRYTLRNTAKYAAEFFKKMSLADGIQLFTNVG